MIMQVTHITVLSTSGTVWAKNAAGDMRPVSTGDQLQVGETIVTGPESQIKLLLPQDESLVIGESETVLLSAEMSAALRPDAQEGALAAATVEQILSALNAGGI